MFSKKEKVLRKIRKVIDVINIILTVVIVGVLIYTFLDVRNRMNHFPVIFYLGAAGNITTGIKHMISDRKIMGLITFVVAVILIIIAGFTKTIVGGPM